MVASECLRFHRKASQSQDHLPCRTRPEGLTLGCVTPAEANARLQQAMTLHQQGRLPEAERVYREVLKHHPRNPAGLHLLGVLALQAGKFHEAVRLIRAALLIDPAEAAAWSNCGEALRALHQYTEAETCYREAVTRAPDNASFWSNLSIALHHLDRISEAETALRRALLLQPNNTKAWCNLGNVLRGQGRFAEAGEALQQALKLQPAMPEAWNALGALLRKQNRLEESENCYRKAIQINPRFAEAYSNLGAGLKDTGRLSEAEAFYRQSLALAPHIAESHSGLASVLRESGLAKQACQGYQEAIRLSPQNPRFLSNLVFTAAANALSPSQEAFAHAQAWGKAVTRAPLCTGPVVTVVGRPLRVGYLSADFKHHAVARFVETLFSSHDRNRVEVFAYSNVANPDATTDAIKAQVNHWHPVTTLSDADAARLIHGHRLDLLIDLNGHTRDSRLAVLGHKPAPVQAAYLGYFATTGLPSIDYWITDSVLHPTDTGELAVEQLWRLPRCWIAYGPPKDSPEVGVSSSPTLTFGSYNHLAKVSDHTIDLWSAALRAVPQACLLLKTRHLADLGTQERVRAAFRTRGIAPERLSFAGHTVGLAAHLLGYHDLDIALDPHPYNGGTTTCDALWMGVPVLTLIGSTMPARMSSSMLTSAGLQDWIARSPDDFVSRAVAHAAAWQSLSSEEKLERRRALRAQATASPLFDSRDLAHALESAYEGMITQRAASPQ